MPSQQASPSGQDRAGLIYGIATVVIVALCALATLPFAETGMTDDFSYVHTAKIFAETGHIVYNGWATAMLGWQILPAALFIKLFGYSYTVVRLSTLICAAMPLAFFMQRSFVRSGITHRNATIATLTVLISPVSMPTITRTPSQAIWRTLPKTALERAAKQSHARARRCSFDCSARRQAS